MSPRFVRPVAAALVLVTTGVAGAPHLGALDARHPAPSDTPAVRYGGYGSRAGNAAEAAYRDLLDHGPRAKVLTAAHRGQWRDAPENSLPAILAAFGKGAEVAEIDVQLTADGVPVLMHDTSVDRTTNSTGNVWLVAVR